jgi:hypothetical protein
MPFLFSPEMRTMPRRLGLLLSSLYTAPFHAEKVETNQIAMMNLAYEIVVQKDYFCRILDLDGRKTIRVHWMRIFFATIVKKEDTTTSYRE